MGAPWRLFTPSGTDTKKAGMQISVLPNGKDFDLSTAGKVEISAKATAWTDLSMPAPPTLASVKL